MKKVVLRSLCASLLLLSGNTKIFADTHHKTYQSPTETFIDMIDEINRTFADDSLFGPMGHFVQRGPTFEAKSLSETLKKIETQALIMQQEARQLRNLLFYGKNITKDDILNATQESKKKLAETRDSFSGLIDAMDANLSEVVEKSKYQVREYEAEEYESGDASTYGVKITLPEFKQENINVIIHTDKKNNRTLHWLEVNGTKDAAPAQEKTEDDDQDKPVIKKTSSQLFTSSKFINGKRSVIEYKDGTIKVTFDLPKDIDTKEGNYTMTFDQEKETLTLEFPKTKPQPNRTAMPLKYTTPKEQQK